MKHSVSGRLKALVVSVTMLSAAMLPNLTAGAPAAAAEEENFARLLQHSMYFYDANMCGTDVDENTLLPWRGDCHAYDAQVPLQPMDAKSVGTNLSQAFIDKYKDVLDPDGDGCVDVSGGFHDAGDHVEFGMPENYTAATLGWGYYEFRDSYTKTGQDAHIETLLRYFNDYLMRCTFRDKDGTVIAHCYQVGDGDIDHALWQSPEVDTMARPAFFLTAEKPQTDYVVSACASLAINYLNFKDTDPEYAEKSLDYAQALWDFANDNPKELSDNGDGPKQYYGSNKWEDDYCWAAAWMYLCTGDASCFDDAVEIFDYYAPSGWAYCWNDMWSGAAVMWAVINQEHPELDLVNQIRKAQGKNEYVFDDFWDNDCLGKCFKTWKALESPGGYAFLNQWGSARYNTAMQLVLLVMDKYHNGDKPSEYSDWAKKQMEYICGQNEVTFKESGGSGRRCFVVGYNEYSAKFPHHRAASGLLMAEDPSPQRHVLYGALVGGPDGSDGHNDTTADYIYNEVTIDYNAAFVGAAAGLYHFYGKDSDKVDENFPPAEENSGEEGSGGNGYWVEAFAVDDLHDDGAGVTKISFMVRTDVNKPSDKISVRYFFNTDEISNISSVDAKELYDQSNAEAGDDGADGITSGPFKYDKMDNIYYVEVSWDGYKIANSGKKYQFSMGMYYGDTWDPTNDYSYQGLPVLEDTDMFGNNNEVRTDYICVYDDGVLIGGIEPDGSVPDGSQPAAPTEKPTQPATEPKTEAPTTDKDDTKINYGDVNCDGEVDLVDVIMLNKNLMIGEKITDKGKKNADVDNNGDADEVDSLNILKSIIHLVELPVK